MKLLNLKPIPTLKEIAKLIELKGIKRKYVAKQLNMTPEYLSNILNGRVSPKNVGETLQRIKEFVEGKLEERELKIKRYPLEMSDGSLGKIDIVEMNTSWKQFQAKKEAENG